MAWFLGLQWVETKEVSRLPIFAPVVDEGEIVYLVSSFIPTDCKPRNEAIIEYFHSFKTLMASSKERL